MKVILPALLLALALPQVAEAKAKVVVTETKVTKAEAKRPALDQSATGGIAPSAGPKADADADPFSQLYPPALDLHF